MDGTGIHWRKPIGDGERKEMETISSGTRFGRVTFFSDGGRARFEIEPDADLIETEREMNQFFLRQRASGEENAVVLAVARLRVSRAWLALRETIDLDRLPRIAARFVSNDIAAARFFIDLDTRLLERLLRSSSAASTFSTSHPHPVAAQPSEPAPRRISCPVSS